MNDKIRAFVAEYLLDLNATQAAIRAGYAPKAAHVQGSRLLRDAKVAALVREGKAAQLSRAELSAARVLEELRRLAFEDRTEILACRTVADVRKLPAALRALVEGFDVLESNVPGLKDGKTDTVRRLRTPSKLAALNLLALHFRILSDVGDSAETTEALLARLDRGRQRNLERGKR